MSTLMAGLLGRVSAQDSVGISEMIMRESSSAIRSMIGIRS